MLSGSSPSTKIDTHNPYKPSAFFLQKNHVTLKGILLPNLTSPMNPNQGEYQISQHFSSNTMHKERKDSLVNTWRNEDKNSHNKSTSRLLFYIVYIYVYICIKISWRIQV